MFKKYYPKFGTKLFCLIKNYEDEYAEILDINSGNDVEINGNKIKAADFMEVFYEMFIS